MRSIFSKQKENFEKKFEELLKKFNDNELYLQSILEENKDLKKAKK